MLKKFSFWLSLFALIVVTFNSLGYDDKSLLFFITSPPLWVLGEFFLFLRRFFIKEIITLLSYTINIGFWVLLGLLIDEVIRIGKIDNTYHKRHYKKLLIKKSGVVVILMTVGLIAFSAVYQYQNSESAIVQVISYPGKYSVNNVRFSVIHAAKQDYGKKHIDKLIQIMQNTNDRDIYTSTVYALGLIRDKNAVKAIMQNYGRFNDPYIEKGALNMNRKTVISMLEPDQPQEIIMAGIAAAEILKYEDFIPALQIHAGNSADKALQNKAAAALKQISKDPRKSNPKWDDD